MKTSLKYPRNPSFFPSNVLFQAHAPLPTITKLEDWNELPVQNFPLFVHGVVGFEQRLAGSCSLYNCFEIDIVLSYVAVLLKSVEPKNIGVISPYAIQVYFYSSAFGFIFVFIGREDKVSASLWR